MQVRRALVTGGSGFLGTDLTRQLKNNGWFVRVLDINKPLDPDLEYIEGDIRDTKVCSVAVSNIDVVFHNVAQVPLAKDRELFRSVNIQGCKTILDSAADSSVTKFIMTSSSAVYGLPDVLPANQITDLKPIEEYGRAKLNGERQINSYHLSKMDVSIIRPRTILGQGRLGLFSILFDWISKGLDVFVLGDGENPYQFIHAKDLVNGIEEAANLDGLNVLNLGTNSFGTLRSDLEALCRYANTGSKVRGIPASLVRKPLLAASKAGLIPFATYQLLLYSQAMYFDSTDDWKKLNYDPKYSNVDCLIDSYEWYVSNKNKFNANEKLSLHQRPTTGVSLKIYERLLKMLPK